MPDLNIAKLVRSIRKNNGWTQERLAQEMGVSFSTVSSWERGKRKPLPFFLKRLQELLEQAQITGNDKNE